MPAPGAILAGHNAQGKTSLLEAICLALSLHSPRSSKLEKLASHGSPSFGISLSSNEGSRRLSWQHRKLEMSVNGIRRKDYADYLSDAPPVVWLGNTDISLVTGGAEERRKYLDFLGIQWHPSYRLSLKEYRKALKSRNLLLRHPRPNPSVLRSYAEILCRHGETIMSLRRQLLNLLTPHISQHHAGISGTGEEVSLMYRPSTDKPLQDAFAQAQAADKRAGYTTVGPHRDDFSLFISGASAAEYASEGQQRTLATAMSLAQASLLQEENGHAPTLLIDDVFGELDPARRKSLLSQLPPDAQVFITTTHLDWLGGEPAPLPVLHVEQGQVRPAP